MFPRLGILWTMQTTTYTETGAARPLVFTDLDGTLLDHHTYRFDAASEMLEYLRSEGIPLIIVTSKTRPEVLKLQQKLKIREPFIVENGAGAFVPSDSGLGGFPTEDPLWNRLGGGKPYSEVRQIFAALQKRFPIRGFGDMKLEEVTERTGLEAVDAADAMRRDFTEPFIMEDGAGLDALRDAVRDAGMEMIRGGRFFHLVSPGQTKGTAVREMAARYAAHYGTPVKIIALGDSENDFSMLEAADRAVLIPRHDGSYADIETEGMVRAPFPGPRGWNAALKEIQDVGA